MSREANEHGSGNMGEANGGSRAPDARKYKKLRRRLPRWLLRLSLRVEVLVARGILALAWVLPVRGIQALGRALGLLVYWLVPRQRGMIDVNLKMAMPHLDAAARRAIARDVLRHQGMTLAETLKLPAIRADGARWVRGEGGDVLARLHARGKGVMMVTAHFGNWEMIPILLQRLDIRATALVRTMNNPRLNEIFGGLRRYEFLDVAERGTPAAARQMLACLKNGNVLIMATDVDMDAQGDFINFFGVPAFTPTAPASLALRQGVPLVTCLDYRQPDGTHLLRIQEVEVTAATAGRADPQLALTQELARLTEEAIRARPELWAWNHARWKKRPPGEGGN